MAIKFSFLDTPEWGTFYLLKEFIVWRGGGEGRLS
ncbi:MAG: hypothetical protein ACJA1W_003259 [Akkermansiaceae bacterium]|jgi:hypothetical protein